MNLLKDLRAKLKSQKGFDAEDGLVIIDVMESILRELEPLEDLSTDTCPLEGVDVSEEFNRENLRGVNKFHIIAMAKLLYNVQLDEKKYWSDLADEFMELSKSE